MKQEILKIADQLTEMQAKSDLLSVFGFSKRILGFDSVSSLIKSIPSEQAKQIIKSDITEIPYTAKIGGELVVAHINE